MKDSGFPFEIQELTDTWKELLDKWGIYQTNPYGEEPKDIPDLGAFTQSIRKKWQEWKKAEERSGSWICLKKIAP